jgi:cytochrome c5
MLLLSSNDFLMRKKIVYLSLIVLASCTATKKAAVSEAVLTQADADRAAVKFPGASLASLKDGQAKYEENCGKCHGLKEISWGNESEWRQIIPPMSEKAGIDNSTQDLITQYLVTAATAPK